MRRGCCGFPRLHHASLIAGGLARLSDRWHSGNLSSARVRALLMSAHCVSGALCAVLADLQSGGRRRLWAACPTPHPALCAAPPPCRPAAGKPKGRGQEMCVRVVPQLLYEHEPQQQGASRLTSYPQGATLRDRWKVPSLRPLWITLLPMAHKPY